MAILCRIIYVEFLSRKSAMSSTKHAEEGGKSMARVFLYRLLTGDPRIFLKPLGGKAERFLVYIHKSVNRWDTEIL